MKKSLTKYLVLFAVIAVALLACQKEEDPIVEETAKAKSNQISQEAGRSEVNVRRLEEVLREYRGRRIEANFIGRVIDERNNPISGAVVSLGGQQETTDDNGIVTFVNAIVYENFAYASVAAQGYTNGSRVMVPNQTTNQNTFTVKLFNLEESQTISSSGGEVAVRTEFGREMIISFDNGFVDENGNSYTGNVNVNVNYLDPLSEDTANTMPGDLYGIDSNYEQVALGSYGMVNVELRGNSGQKLQIVNPARIVMPIHPDQIGTAANQVPMWSFNEAAGVWVEEAVAYRNGGYYIAEVNHFSFWNCDAPFPVVNFDATVVDAGTGNPLAGVKVTISYSSFSRYAITDSNGNVSGKIPSGQVLTITITDQCGTVLSTGTYGPYSGTTSLTLPVTLATAPINISGTVLNCSGLPVTNGYVTYTNSSGLFLGTSLVTAGTHSYTGISCTIPVNVDLEGGDMSTGQVIGTTTVTANPNATANLVACGGVAAEYIRYSINGNPFQYDILNPYAGLEGTNYIYMGAAGGANSRTSIITNTTTLGGPIPFDFNLFSLSTPAGVMKELSAPNGIDHVGTTAVPGAVTFTITSFGPVGTYIDISFSGNYVDQLGNTNTITGDAHIIRDF